MELRVGCRRPVEEPIPGLKRYRIASKIIKGQVLGGTDDEWVVIEPIHRAIELLEQLHDDPRDGVLLLSRFNFRVRYLWFRAWVNSPAGARLELTPIPDELLTLRMLRRTVALEMAYRPGGILAAKLHLKHIAAATTEGYAARPGGAQAELLAEVNKHEADHKLQLVLAEFRNYQQGILPAGPAARSLTGFFATVDADLNTESTAAPKIQRNDRDILGRGRVDNGEDTLIRSLIEVGCYVVISRIGLVRLPAIDQSVLEGVADGEQLVDLVSLGLAMHEHVRPLRSGLSG